MGMLTTYFSAGSDSLAAQTIDWSSGPQEGPPRRLLKKREGGYPSVDGYGIEPIVELGMFEQLLTGKSFTQQLNDPASRRVIASKDGGLKLVVRIGDDFTQALAASSPEQLSSLAGEWASIEEFGGRADPQALADRAVALSALARSALSGSAHLYCWLAV